jgi:hypothetical protein
MPNVVVGGTCKAESFDDWPWAGGVSRVSFNKKQQQAMVDAERFIDDKLALLCKKYAF